MVTVALTVKSRDVSREGSEQLFQMCFCVLVWPALSSFIPMDLVQSLLAPHSLSNVSHHPTDKSGVMSINTDLWIWQCVDHQ